MKTFFCITLALLMTTGCAQHATVTLWDATQDKPLEGWDVELRRTQYFLSVRSYPFLDMSGTTDGRGQCRLLLDRTWSYRARFSNGEDRIGTGIWYIRRSDDGQWFGEPYLSSNANENSDIDLQIRVDWH